jgi:ATP/maltotriose-dependent transcriptional regulator MalT
MWGEGGELVGRAGEQRAIRDALRDRSGVHLVAIEGPPGIGKTRLLDETAALARDGGAGVLSARGSELERALPFGVMRQLLEPVLVAASGGERARLLEGAAALAEPALTPRGEAPPADTFAILSGIYWLIANLASARPLVLCVDDLHWADNPSLRALAYLLVRLDGVDAQLCVAQRPHEPGGSEDLLDAVLQTPRRVMVRPGPLDQAATTELVRARMDPGADDAFCAACRTTTGGSPLLLVELTRELTDRGVAPTAAGVNAVQEAIPSGIAPSVLRRLARVHREAADVARAVAILGDGADPAHVAALCELDAGAANAILEALARVGILAAAAPATFAHPLVRAAVATSVDVAERGRLHLAAARLLAADGAAAPVLATHLIEAPQAGDPWVARTLGAAGADALHRGAPELAARLLRRALSEPPPADERAALLLTAGGAEARTGDERALAHLREAVATATDPDTYVASALTLVAMLGGVGESRAAVALALEAQERLPPDDDLRLVFESEILNMTHLDNSLRDLGLERMAGLDVDRLGGTPGGCRVLAVLATESLADGASRAEAVDRAERALAGGRLLDAVFMYAHAANSLMISGHYGRAIGAWDEFIRGARARGDVVGIAVAHAFRASALWHAGGLDEALVDAQLAIELAPPHVSAIAAAFAHAFRIEALVLRGELAEARTTLAIAAGPIEHLPTPILLGARGRLRLAEGRVREALEDMRAVGRLLEEWRIPNSALAPWRGEAALALAALGQGDEAVALIEQEVAAARRWGEPWLLGQALRVSALVGPPPVRRPRLQEAVEVLRPSEGRLELARALTELGIAEHGAGHGLAAREPLREAVEIATACAAPAVAQRAREALVAAGGRPRRAAATGPLALTPTERRVARIAAGGVSNREIAQTLFVAEKTVETHLASAYRKLGIRARGQLAGALSAGR